MFIHDCFNVGKNRKFLYHNICLAKKNKRHKLSYFQFGRSKFLLLLNFLNLNSGLTLSNNDIRMKFTCRMYHIMFLKMHSKIQATQLVFSKLIIRSLHLPQKCIHLLIIKRSTCICFIGTLFTIFNFKYCSTYEDIASFTVVSMFKYWDTFTFKNI